MDNLTEQQKKCMECRECCEYVEYPVTMLSLEVVEYFLFRGEQMYIHPKTGVMSIRVFKPCIHLANGTCSIYEDRPYTCREYMCEFKDKTIKDVKDRQCSIDMERIRVQTKKYRLEASEKNDLRNIPET